MAEKMAPVHPGEILREEFMKPLDISQNQLARDLGVSPRRINEIVNEKRAITADTALRLSCHFDTTARFWLNLQTRYELESARDESGEKIEKTVKRLKTA